MKLIHGDCLVEMASIADKSVDMILCDLPYGTTACKWDTVIPFEPLWSHYKRIIKDRGAIVLFGAQPFTSILISSCFDLFKYTLVWEKDCASNFAQCKNRPLKYHEDLAVFGKQLCYYPVMWDAGFVSNRRGINNSSEVCLAGSSRHDTYTNSTLRYPKSIIKFSVPKGNGGGRFHPTQKPVALLEYLIKTYTLEGATVLDNCMGSGSTGVACLNTGRHFIGIEKDDKYFAVASDRIAKVVTGSQIPVDASVRQVELPLHPPAELCA